MSGIRASKVSKCLDKKLVIFGFEIIDILIIFLTISILNLIFGESQFKLLFVWVPSLLLSLILYLGKKGKPDNYLIHWFRYHFSPGIYSAFKDSIHEDPLKRVKKNGK